LEATQLASSGEPLSLDDLFAAIARLSKDRDVPLRANTVCENVAAVFNRHAHMY
jgi:hypothetical protein